MTDASFMEYAPLDEVELDPPRDEADVEEILVRLANVRARLAEVDFQYACMKERYDAWKDRVQAPLKSAEAVLTDTLSQWAFAKIEADPKGAKSFDLPSGSIHTRAGQDKVEIEDENAFIERWGGSDFIRQPDPPAPKPDKRFIKSVLATGQEVEGAYLVQGERSVSIYTEAME